jgi:hypothetical protein
MGTLPNLIVIGASKCGTTSLHYYLNLHPQIEMSWEKEIRFFSLQENWEKGASWYMRHFPGKCPLRGESSPGYSAYPVIQGVPARMHSLIPDAKLIYLVRDPLERLVSAYITLVAEGTLNCSFAQAFSISDQDPEVCRCKYFMQLEQYLDYFPASSVKVVAAEDLRTSRRAVLRDIFEFLGVNSDFESLQFDVTQNPSNIKRKKGRLGMWIKKLGDSRLVCSSFSANTRRKVGKFLYLPVSARVERPVPEESFRKELISFLREDTRRLRAFSGLELNRWSL